MKTIRCFAFALTLVSIFMCVSPAARAYVPTVESLFRNASNPDVNENMIQLDFILTATDGSQEQYVQMFFQRENSSKMNFLQVKYDGTSSNKQNISGLYSSSQFLQSFLQRDETEPNKGFFYGLMLSLLWNDSRLMSHVLKATNNDYRPNTAMLNEEKRELYIAYRDYLKKVKDNPALAKELNSPLKPVVPEEKEKVSKINKEDLYSKPDNVKLGKSSTGDIVWIATLENSSAEFTHAAYRFVKLNYRGQDLEIVAKNYGLLNGQYEFPREMSVKGTDGQSFTLKVVSLKHTHGTPRDIGQKLDTLKGEWTKKNKERQEQGAVKFKQAFLF